MLIYMIKRLRLNITRSIVELAQITIDALTGTSLKISTFNEEADKVLLGVFSSY